VKNSKEVTAAKSTIKKKSRIDEKFAKNTEIIHEPKFEEESPKSPIIEEIAAEELKSSNKQIDLAPNSKSPQNGAALLPEIPENEKLPNTEQADVSPVIIDSGDVVSTLSQTTTKIEESAQIAALLQAPQNEARLDSKKILAPVLRQNGNHEYSELPKKKKDRWKINEKLEAELEEFSEPLELAPLRDQRQPPASMAALPSFPKTMAALIAKTNGKNSIGDHKEILKAETLEEMFEIQSKNFNFSENMDYEEEEKFKKIRFAEEKFLNQIEIYKLNLEKSREIFQRKNKREFSKKVLEIEAIKQQQEEEKEEELVQQYVRLF